MQARFARMSVPMIAVTLRTSPWANRADVLERAYLGSAGPDATTRPQPEEESSIR